MKRLAIVLTATASLTIGACSGGTEDQVNNAELNQPAAELNDLANEAANTAMEANALESQAQNLENAADAAADNTVNPKDADEQNVAGM